MTTDEVRKRFLDFAKSHDHAIIPSAPVVPEGDATTLFTSSGMQQLVPYLAGRTHPSGTRLADSQPSFRAEDIEEVGDNRHTTFFEMLGNWSLGDYFKKEQLAWVFEFLTDTEKGLGLDPQKLFVTVFGGDGASHMSEDEESVHIWQEIFSTHHISNGFAQLDTEEAASMRGMQEGERIFAYGAKKNWWSRAGVPSAMPIGEIGGPDSEIFYDFGTPHDSRFGTHCHPNCDCGRFVEIGNSVFMQFVKQADGTFSELPKKNVDFGGGLERMTAATRNNPDIFLVDVFDEARTILDNAIHNTYGTDANATRSMRIILDHVRAATFMLSASIVPSNREQGYIVRRLLRRAIREMDTLAISSVTLSMLAACFGRAYGKSYPVLLENMQFIQMEIEKEETQFKKTLAKGLHEFEKMGDTVDPFILFTTYGFPVELTEEIAHERGIPFDRDAVYKKMKEHQEESRRGATQKFAGGLADHEQMTIRYHTAHHLLLAALQKVLGESVHQRGSNITSERLRMDFSFERKLTEEEKHAVEALVNEKIKEALPVVRTLMKKELAESLHAEHEFGAKYPEEVSVYSIGPKNATEADPDFPHAFSIEFCGGPHVHNTGELATNDETFRILKEEASSHGVRRIKAIIST